MLIIRNLNLISVQSWTLAFSPGLAVVGFHYKRSCCRWTGFSQLRGVIGKRVMFSL